MFRKENSSCATAKAKPQADAKPQNKKGKKNQSNNNAATPARALDTPLRKSDIRNLRQAVRDFFLQDREDPIVDDILDQVFLANHVATRHLHHAELGKLILYVRLPNADLATPTPTTSTNFVWPYAISQILWIAQPPMPHSKSPEVAVPTLALLSVLPPGILPTVYIPPHASKFLCRGAHLMRAGMMNLPSAWMVPQPPNSQPTTGRAALLQPQPPPRITAVCIVGNPQPMAVGLVDDGVRSVEEIGPETKGIGVTLWTCYGDDLWKQQLLELETVPHPPVVASPYGGGASYNDGQYGNVGFVAGQEVLPIGNQQEDDEGGGEKENGEEAAEGVTATEEAEETVDETTTTNNGESPVVEPETTPTPDDNKNEDEDEEATTSETNNDTPADGDNISQDDLLHQSVCKAFLTSVSPKDLPMTVANFYAHHVLPNRPEGTTIQLKQTKYKKFGTYLQEQVERKLLTLGPGPNKANKDKTGYLMSFDKRHPDLLNYRDENAEAIQQARESNQAAEATKQLKLVLVNLYIVPHHLVSKLRLDPDAVKAVHASSPERAGTGMLTAPEVRALLEDYLTRENLNQADEVQLDGPLFDALFQKQKGGGGEVTNDTLLVSRKDVNDQWIAAMNKAYAIVQMPGNQVQKLGHGQPPKVQIEVSARSGKKFITKIRGMEAYGINGQVLAKDVGRRLACQASVETTSVTALPKGCVEIVLGGNFADEMEALLLGDEKLCPGHGGVKNSDYKLPKGSVDVVLRKGVPARKKRGGATKKQ